MHGPHSNLHASCYRLHCLRAALVSLQAQSRDPQMKWALPTGRVQIFLDIKWNNY